MDTIIRHGRRVGNSTRLIDKYIQDLFEGFETFTFSEVITYDHYGSKEANDLLFRKVLGRLQVEHGLTTVNTNPFYLRVNAAKWKIQLVENKPEKS